MFNMFELDMDNTELEAYFVEQEYLDITPALIDIGQNLVQSVRDTIDTGGHSTWSEHKDSTEWWPLLKKTDELYNSIYYSIENGDEVHVQDDTSYGHYLDQGTSQMEAREYLVIQDQDVDSAEETLSRLLG